VAAWYAVFWSLNQEMDVRTIIQIVHIQIVCLALLVWIEPAGAQQVYSLKVSIHKDLPKLTEDQIDDALDRASSLLKEPGNQCNVTLKRNGAIETFEFDSAPKNIRTPDDLEAVHRVPGDVKIVESIHYCMGKYDKVSWWGCSWRPEGLAKTVIVVRGMLPGPVVGRDRRYLLWAHEFGHTKGLHHRVDDERALLTPCAIKTTTRRITNDECTCFQNGPEGCKIPPPAQEATCQTPRP
jgi:hypothetical protein